MINWHHDHDDNDDDDDDDDDDDEDDDDYDPKTHLTWFPCRASPHAWTYAGAESKKSS